MDRFHLAAGASASPARSRSEGRKRFCKGRETAFCRASGLTSSAEPALLSCRRESTPQCVPESAHPAAGAPDSPVHSAEPSAWN